MPARDAAERVIAMLDGLPAACDGLSIDQRWWARLHAETPSTRGIRLTSHAGLLQHKGEIMRHHLDTAPTLHRAGADALRLMEAFALGAGRAFKVLRLLHDGTPENDPR